MLKRASSLKLRAALIFLPIYVATVISAMLFLSSASLSFEEDHHTGPNMALTFAADDLVADGAALRLRPGGAFSELAADNRSLWLIIQRDNRLQSFGPVPKAAPQLFLEHRATVESARFHVPGVERPLSDAAVDSLYTPAGTLLMAAGGVDPLRISLAHTFRYFLGQGLFVLLMGLGLLGLLTMLLALPLLTSALKPVIAGAAAIRPDNRDRRVREEDVPRELLPLVRVLNRALDGLAEALFRRERFIADVAHELRTPLAILTLQVEATPESEEKRDMTTVLARLSNLVAQMLDAERLTLAGVLSERIDLRDLARHVVSQMAPMAIGAGYTLSLDAPESEVLVTGDRHALTRAISNLVNNAIAHAGGKGRIRVIVGEQSIIDVVDEGPGVQAECRDTVFEPFSRGQWDRDGCGLGLHLVAEVMRAHGGQALLLPSEKGAAFRLQLPPPTSAPARS